jgi:glycosyltransferase involved in cell wall biosynthesis
VAATTANYIVFIDADGTYPTDEILAMLSEINEYDMVVGARIGENTHIPLVRKPAKWFLQKLASYLAGQNIPDLNSGLRVIKKPLLEKFNNILPSGFSLTTTITLALLCNNYFVYYHPIDYFKRVGQSKIRPVEAYNFFLLILRTIIYFNPLKVFLPLGAVFFLAGSIKLIYDIYLDNLSESAVMGILSAFIIWAIGLLSDQISKLGIGK